MGGVGGSESTDVAHDEDLLDRLAERGPSFGRGPSGASGTTLILAGMDKADRDWISSSGMSDPETLTRALDRGGYHLTAPRRVVAEMVAARDGRFSAQDLVDEARQGRRGVGRATVFRSLEIFEALGLVERVHMPNGEHAYVACEPAHHHHVVCERCGRSSEVGDLGIRAIARDLEKRTGYLLDSHRIELFGLCPDCRAATATRA